MAAKTKTGPKPKHLEPKKAPKGWARREIARGAFWSPWADAADVEQHGLCADNPVQGTVLRFRTIRSGAFDKPQAVMDIEHESGPVTIRINGNLPGQLGAIVDRETGTITLDGNALGAGEVVSIEWLGKQEPSKQFPQGVHQYDVLVRE